MKTLMSELLIVILLFGVFLGYGLWPREINSTNLKSISEVYHAF